MNYIASYSKKREALTNSAAWKNRTERRGAFWYESNWRHFDGWSYNSPFRPIGNGVLNIFHSKF
jgi:hypothetical protein